ncbi:MAG TPA: nuclear transport factor 2 family protein [Steroidobacteraceae bacterium]|nr:nuclear transport factor 2 family protein [Steroidobacteraceae bacterium]
MDEIRALLAKAEIAELITRYAARSDAGDWEAVAQLYTEDGRMSRPVAPTVFIAGRAAILESLRSRPPRAARHIVGNILVSLTDEAHASASSQILLYTGTAANDGGLPLLSATAPLIGTYQDTLVNAGGGWRFAERRGSLDFRAP